MDSEVGATEGKGQVSTITEPGRKLPFSDMDIPARISDASWLSFAVRLAAVSPDAFGALLSFVGCAGRDVCRAAGPFQVLLPRVHISQSR